MGGGLGRLEGRTKEGVMAIFYCLLWLYASKLALLPA
jgi:hypothetical protein